MELKLKGRAIVPGIANGQALVSHKTISFWGGVDPHTGEVIDLRHDRVGAVISGKVFMFPAGKGSSTGSAVLMEGIRNGTAPAAIINARVDPILALGAIVAEELYHKTVPIVVLSQADFEAIQDGDILAIQIDGTVLVNGSGTGCEPAVQ
jgi:predicted aconitase with swiveling domain